MGVIGLIFIVWIIVFCHQKIKNSSAQKPSKPRTKLEDINSVAIGGVEIPKGDQTLSVYVYDGTPVKGVAGSVKLVIAPRTIRMTSIYSGTTWTESCAVYAGGKPIGFMFDRHPSKDVKELAFKHGHAVVHGRVIAPFRQGEWPSVYLDLPRKDWFDVALGRSRKESYD